MDTPRQFRAVAFFSEVSAPVINGVVASIDGLRAGLRDADIDVTLFTPRMRNARDSDATIVRLPSLPLPTSTGYRLCLPMLSSGARARVARAQIVHVHSPFVTGWLGADIARRRGIPLVFTYHTRIDAYAHYAPFEPRIARNALIALTRTFANRCDTVIAPSAAMRDRLREIGVRVPIAIVPSSIDVQRFARGERSPAMRARSGARDGERIALIVARLAREKNIDRAIDALAHTRGVRLVVAGDGPYRAALEARARERNVAERITFTGALDPALLPDLYAASDAFVFPSTTETQGLVLAEALAAGLPVVAIDGAVNREMLGGFGRLVSGDAAEMGAAIDAAVRSPRDPDATACAAERFGRERQTGAVIKIYTSISVCRTFGTPVRDHALGS